MSYRNKLLTLLGCALLGSTANAAVNTPDAAGYDLRGTLMYIDVNPLGATDQLTQMLRLTPQDIESNPFATEDARLLIAMSALRQGSADAPILLEQFINDYPRSPRLNHALAAWGDWWFRQGSYADALKIYSRINLSSPDNALATDVAYRRAFCRLMLSDFDNAATEFETMAYGDGIYAAPARFYLGYIAYRRGDSDRALELMLQAARHPEVTSAANIYLAQIYYSKGEPDSALAYARKALQTGYKMFHPEANRIAGESLYALGRREEGVPYLWLYAASNPTDIAPSTCYILGIDEYANGHYPEAASMLQRAVTTNDAMAQSAWLYLGQSKLRSGDEDAAAMAFDHAARMTFSGEIAETAAYNYAVARTRGAKMPFGSSVQLFEDFLTRYPSSRHAQAVRDYIISGYMADNNYTGALKALSAMPRDSYTEQALQRVHFTLGTRLYNDGKYAEALPHLSAAADSRADDEMSLEALLWTGMCQQAMEQYDRAAESARSYLARAPKRDEQRALALYNLGYAEFGDEKFSDALVSFRKSIDAASADESAMTADAYCRVADCLYYLSDFDSAAEAYSKSVQINPDAADYATFQLAVMKGLKRNHTQKIVELDHLMARYPSSPLAPAALLEKAQSLVALNRNSEALDVYNLLQQNYPGSAYARKGLLQRAITAAAIGQTEQAEQDYKTLIQTYPTSEEARLAVDDLKLMYAESDRLQELNRFLATVPQAPTPERSEMDVLTFEAAERVYINDDDTSRLEEYLRLYPGGRYEAQALYYLAQSAANSGNSEQAVQLTTRLLTNWPDADVALDAMLIQADAEHSKGNHVTAMRIYRDIESRAGSPSMLLSARTGILETGLVTGSYSEALAAADKILSSTAAADRTRNTGELRAQALQGLGRHEDAIRQWKSVVKGGTTDLPGTRAAVHLSAALITIGRNAEAKKQLNSFIDSQSPHPYWTARAFILLSDVLRSEGQEFEADEYLRSLRANYPGTEADIFEQIDQRLGR